MKRQVGPPLCLLLLAGVCAPLPPQPLTLLHVSPHFEDISLLLGSTVAVPLAHHHSLTLGSHNHSTSAHVVVQSTQNRSHVLRGADSLLWYTSNTLNHGVFFAFLETSANVSKAVAVAYPDNVMAQYEAAATKLLVVVNAILSETVYLYLRLIGGSFLSLAANGFVHSGGASLVHYMQLNPSVRAYVLGGTLYVTLKPCATGLHIVSAAIHSGGVWGPCSQTVCHLGVTRDGIVSDFVQITSNAPSRTPTIATNIPSITPSSTPSIIPSSTPSITPSSTPSITPSSTPSITPSSTPSSIPSSTPSSIPSSTPTSSIPSSSPTSTPSSVPSSTPSTTARSPLQNVPLPTPTTNAPSPTEAPTSSPASSTSTTHSPGSSILTLDDVETYIDVVTFRSTIIISGLDITLLTHTDCTADRSSTSTTSDASGFTTVYIAVIAQTLFLSQSQLCVQITPVDRRAQELIVDTHIYTTDEASTRAIRNLVLSELIEKSAAFMSALNSQLSELDVGINIEQLEAVLTVNEEQEASEESMRSVLMLLVIGSCACAVLCAAVICCYCCVYKRFRSMAPITPLSLSKSKYKIDELPRAKGTAPECNKQSKLQAFNSNEALHDVTVPVSKVGDVGLRELGSKSAVMNPFVAAVGAVMAWPTAPRRLPPLPGAPTGSTVEQHVVIAEQCGLTCNTSRALCHENKVKVSRGPRADPQTSSSHVQPIIDSTPLRCRSSGLDGVGSTVTTPAVIDSDRLQHCTNAEDSAAVPTQQPAEARSVQAKQAGPRMDRTTLLGDVSKISADDDWQKDLIDLLDSGDVNPQWAQMEQKVVQMRRKRGLLMSQISNAIYQAKKGTVVAVSEQQGAERCQFTENVSRETPSHNPMVNSIEFEREEIDVSDVVAQAENVVDNLIVNSGSMEDGGAVQVEMDQVDELERRVYRFVTSAPTT